MGRTDVKKRETVGRLSLRMALRLAAPQTWSASVTPALWAGAAARERGAVPLPLLLCLTGVCVLMQSAVNTLNDYSDFLSGTDTADNCPDPEEAVLLYDRPAPRRVLFLGLGFLLAAALLGVPALLRAGWRPLAVGAVGALAVLGYAFGAHRLPLGELVSGFVMGGLIPLGVFGTLTGDFSLRLLPRALPLMLGIALIMLTNNGCDREKDLGAGRRTLPVRLGGARTARLYRALLALWALLPLTFPGRVFYLLALVPALPPLVRQARLTLSQETRGQAMSGVVSLQLLLALACTAALLFGGGA